MQIPSAINVVKSAKELELCYGEQLYRLSFELLRVFSPSAEVRGHGVGNEVLQHGKRDVGLVNIEPVGNYALKFVFDDGHDSGLYDWGYLQKLCLNQTELWQEYLDKLAKAGLSRESQFIQINQL